MKIIKNKILLLLVIILCIFQVSSATDCPSNNGNSWTTVNLKTNSANRYGHFGSADAQIRDNLNGTFDVQFDWTTLINDSGGMLSNDAIKKIIISEGLESLLNGITSDCIIKYKVFYKSTCYSDVTLTLAADQNWSLECCDPNVVDLLESQMTDKVINGITRRTFHTHYKMACGEKCCYREFIFHRYWDVNSQTWKTEVIDVITGDDGCVKDPLVNLGKHCDPPYDDIPCVGGDCSKP